MTATIIFVFLFNAILLSALFAGTAWAAIRFLKIENAAAQAVLWAAAFFLSVAAPFASFAPGGVEAAVVHASPAPSIIQMPENLPAGAAAPAPVMAKSAGPSFSIANTGAALFIVLWLAGSAWRAAFLVRDALAITRLRWESAPLGAHSAASHLPHGVSLRTHPAITVPIASGLFRPAIILPEKTAGALDAEAAQSAIAHELAHIKRGDLVFSLAEALALCAFWWNPLLWKMRTKIIVNREMACDDSAIATTNDPAAYARTLIEFAERALVTREGNTHHAALAASGEPSDLKQRITRLMSHDYADHLRPSLLRLALAGAAMASVSLCAAAAAPRLVIDAAGSAVSASFTQSPAASDAERLGRLLVNAISDGDWAGADTLIAAGADINAVLYGDGTPLIAAVRAGSINYAGKLIAMGADVELAALYDETALISAVRSQNPAMVRLLIEAGADVNKTATTETGEIRSPLGEAERLRAGEITRLLRDAGAA